MEVQNNPRQKIYQKENLCCFNFEDDLLDSLKCRDLTRFSDILQTKQVNVDLIYPHPLNKSCLEFAVEFGLENFIWILLEHNVNPNLWNPITKTTPLHIAVMHARPSIVNILLQNGSDPNAKNSLGRTPLHLCLQNLHHYAISNETNECKKEEIKQCIIILLKQQSLKIDIKDNKGYTPLHLSCLINDAKLAEMLINYGANVNIECVVTGKTAKEMLTEQFGRSFQIGVCQKTESINNRWDKSNTVTSLYDALQEENLQKFQSILEKCENIDQFQGNYNCLQYSCNHKLLTFSRLLLEKGSNPNIPNITTGWYPIHYAADNGDYEILGLLLQYQADVNAQDKIGDTALHKIVKKDLHLENENKNMYIKCMQTLLEISYLNVNLKDNQGNTTLHLCTFGWPQIIIKKLIKMGANIGMKNNFGETPIERILPETLESFLNECIEPDETMPVTSEKFTMNINYSFLKPPKLKNDTNTNKTQSLPETESIWYMSNIKIHQHLMKHPVITSFIYLKWQKVKLYFYLNCLFYIIFLILLTSLFFINDNYQKTYSLLWWCTAISNSILMIREVFQIIISPIRYFFLVENILEWILIITVFIVLNNSKGQFLTPLKAIILLISWTELIMLLGRHPSFSLYVRMFTTVSFRFLKFTGWYSVLLVAFTLSFNQIFHTSNSFTLVHNSFMKTTVMMAGEFDFSELPINNFPVVTHFIFLSFVFLITIVLMNLLTALAVSDTQNIINKAEIFGYISQVELISYLESILLGDPFKFLANYPPFKWIPHYTLCAVSSKFSFIRYFSILGQKILLFQTTIPNYRITIYPNVTHVYSTNTGEKLFINLQIIRAAMAIAQKKISIGDQITFEQTLNIQFAELQSKIKNIENQMNMLIKMLEKIIHNHVIK